MRIYLLSCETPENSGGVYAYDLSKEGKLKKEGYFPCDRPMYAVNCKKGLCVLLRQPFKNSNESGYFFVDHEVQRATEIVSTKGVVACHLCVDNENVYVVNYLSGNIVKNGEIVAKRVGKSVHPTRQTEPHTHFVGETPDGYLAVCDLGTDSLAIYDKNLRVISENKVPVGYGIRHLVFSKDGKYIYAVNELVPSVSVFAYENGQASYLQTVHILCEKENASGATVRLSENGQYLYVSIREENAIVVFKTDGAGIKRMQKIDCGGDSPRDFNIVGNALICMNEKSGNVTVFSLSHGQAVNKTDEKKIKNALCCVKR